MTINNEQLCFLRKKVNIAKQKVFDMCVSAGMGHITSAYSCAEIAVVLYYEIMRIKPENPDWEDRDRFMMSKNHGSVMTYPILADLGYIDEEELSTFMKDDTRLGGHSKLTIPGIDFAGGSLGIGLGVAAGLAYSAKMDNRNFLTYVILGDGECYEGSIWEAAMFASHNELSNLVAIVDRNKLSCTDFTEKILKLEPLAAKWEAFGWETISLNGHDISALCDALSKIRSVKQDKPLVIIADTVKGNGIDFMSDAPLYHGVIPRGENDINRARLQLEA